MTSSQGPIGTAQARTDAARLGQIRWIATIGTLCSIGLYAAYAAGLHGDPSMPVDHLGAPLGRDFLNTWFYGRAFFLPDPGRFYEPAVYANWLRTAISPDVVTRIWSYPPPFLLLAAPFGALPYSMAVAAWTCAGLGALGAAVHERRAPWLTLAVLTSPMVTYSVIAGQVSLFCAAVLVTIFKQLDRRPFTAGLLIALLMVKPQAAVLFPFFLLASRRWRTLAGAVVGCGFVVLVSVIANGPRVWVDYVTFGLPSQIGEMHESLASLAGLSMSVTNAATMLGLPSPFVGVLQGAACLTALTLIVIVGRHRPRSGEIESLVVLTCAIFAQPYVLVHDLVAFDAVLLIAAAHTDRFDNRLALLSLLYLPVFQMALAPLHVHLVAFVPVAFALWLVVTEKGAPRPLGGPRVFEAPPSLTGGRQPSSG